MTLKRRPHISKALRKKVLSRFDERCGYCGARSEKLELDHIEPFCSDFNKDDESNYMPACKPCNRFKGGMRLEEFRCELAEQAIRALKYSVNVRMALAFDQIKFTPSDIVFYFERD